MKSCYVDDDLSSSVTVVRRRESLLSDDIISNRYSFVEIINVCGCEFFKIMYDSDYKFFVQ